jgi:DNA-directed RNA polymerase II subunit RPB2
MNNWQIIDTYFNSLGNIFTKHHLDSYNEFVLKKIPYTIKTLNPITLIKNNNEFKVEVYIHENVKIQPPIYYDENNKEQYLYPNIARLYNNNYISNIITDITIKYYHDDKIVNTTEFKDKRIGSLPILLHSKLCYLNGVNKQELNELGECPYDNGGYFIVDGKEKVIISQERIATNQLFISESKDPEMYLLEGMIRSTSITNNLFPKSVYFWILNDTNSSEYKIRMKIMNISLEQIPIFLIFRALGIESDKEILNYVSVDDEYIKTYLRGSIVDAHSNEIFSQNDALKYLSNFVKYKDETFVKYIILNDLFPNVGDDPRHKAMYMGHLIKKLIYTANGHLKMNKRDNYMFKRVDTTGILLGNIFRDFYNKMKNTIINQIDREYTFGGSKNKLALVNESNIKKIIDHTIISDGLYKSLKGNWGLTGDPSRQGIVQDVSRLSYISYISHMRRVNTPMDRSLNLADPHRLDSPQWGMMCPIESPDGSNIGLLKHMSVSCEITLESNREEIIECLNDLEMIPLSNVTPYNIKDSCKVLLNNNWIGVHKTPHYLHKTLKTYRQKGVLNAFISISWNILEKELNIYSDSGRTCRPILINNKLKDFKYEENWDSYVNGYSYEYTYNKKAIDNTKKHIEYIDCFETNELYISMEHNNVNKHHTHIEIHPCLSLSLYTNTIPFAHHNQAPRNVFSGQQGKQAVGIYSTAFNNRFDTASYILHYPQQNIITTKMAKYAYKNEMPNGENLIVAIATYSGYNQEDSIIVNKNSIERGMFNVSYFKTVSEQEDTNEFTNEKLVFDNPYNLKKEGKIDKIKLGNWDNIDDNGIPKIGSYIGEDDIYLGKVNIQTSEVASLSKNVFTEKKKNTEYIDKSKKGDKTLQGTIDDVIVYKKNESYKTKIKFRKFRIPELGDKMASSHGQKGVCGMILPQEDMPHNTSGLVPDIIVNPHAFPSRMTIAHLIECVLSKLCCINGMYIDGTIFEKHDFDKYYDILQSKGFNKYGNEILYNGYTGEQIDTEIFIGPTFYYRLKHMVKDKINYRSGGPVDSLTKQPTQGRANGGGLRIGEMETNAILAHGTASFIKESLMERSDKYSIYIDGVDGDDTIFNENEEMYSSINASKIEIPYSMKLLKHEVASLGINMKLLTKNIYDDK